MRLIDAKSKDLVRVKTFAKECGSFVCRINSMGIKKGDIIKVLNSSFFGPILVEANGSKIAICRGEAKKIEIEKIKEN